MMIRKRKKIVLAQLERDLEKIEKRIQKLAENAYHLRQAITSLTPAIPVVETQSTVIQEAANIAAKELSNQTIPQES